MKSAIYLSLLFFSFLLVSCLDNISVEEIREYQKGSVSLKIDKATAPDNVTLVIARLIRQGYNTLSDTMNLTSGTSAELTFQNIPVGEWNLKVDAFNDSGIVVYKGESPVTIIEGMTTQVTLTLIPTGSGTGSVHIVVNWGVPTLGNWIDFNGNPIFSRLNSPLNPNAVSQAKILYDNGVYKMWFNNVFNSAVGKIGYAQSVDGINWSLVHPTAVLSPGNPGSWDSYSVGINAVLKDSSGYKMYFSGYQNQYEMWHIGLATSSDGINWTKRNTPVLSANSNQYQLVGSDVIKVGGIYYLYYCVINENNFKIYLAISNNGANWERYSGNPVLTVSQSWEGSGIYYASVIYENNQFKMVYSNKNANALGTATSADGKNWTKNSNNPFFNANQSSNNWTTWIGYPFYRKFGSEYRIYYTGGSQINYAIGFVRKVN